MPQLPGTAAPVHSAATLPLVWPPVIPEFRAPWWLRSGHAQTLYAGYWAPAALEPATELRRIALPDGDVLVVHDSCPEGWTVTDGAVLLVHGLAGSARSPLLLRLAQRLYEQGRRVFRLDLRGCGAGLGLARLPYHAGRSEDLAEVVAAIQTWTSTTGTSASLVLFGVSLSGNILLKYMGEQGTALPVNIAGALAVNPPIDLAQCVASLRRPMNRGYDRFFVRALRRQLAVHLQRFPEAPRPEAGFAPRTLYEFDDGYTAPVSGYDNARNYYALCSAAQFLPRICRPTLILTADNDPLVSAQLFTAQPVSDSVAVHVVTGGGHVGYRGCAGRDADPHWLDWRVVEFVTACLHAQ